ncbi:alpha/beta hydrolase [Mycobacterium sp. AMU20-3851]|uniref:alpha/beta hydrolase n=1 Tax=Mycobacterium sp. AMU20-3851 TaxID=3122055 RepID=UPI0037551D35
MTMSAKRRRAHDKLAALPGVRPVRRPVTRGGDQMFDLYYVRVGRKSAHPVVVIPGGPGLASVAPYRAFRRHAAAAGYDVIMVEHRGVGLSRHDDDGADLPPGAITVKQVVDDIAAVLDDAGVQTAHIYGSSYGSYIAAGVGVRHPGRVAGMVLDSPVLSAGDIDEMRTAIRGLLWDGTEAADEQTPDLALKVRKLADEGMRLDGSAQVASLVYEYGGTRLLDRQLELLLRGRTLLWEGLSRALRIGLRKAPYRHEDDLVSRIAFRELNFAGEPDGLPLDPSVVMRDIHDPSEEFEREPFDLVAEMPGFGWPTAVLSGGRDLTTPPAVAKQVVDLIPGAILVTLPSAGHSVLDTRERAALEVIGALRVGLLDTLAARGAELDRLPVNPLVRAAITAITAAAAIESTLPAAVPRIVSRIRVS